MMRVPEWCMRSRYAKRAQDEPDRPLAKGWAISENGVFGT